ncbi:MAG: DUF819 domain-containing protein [Cryomorphaceae bacterium]|nr:DUF819 family protein [Flavobacteriales bacterium]
MMFPIENDAITLGILIVVLAAIFKTNSMPRFAGFYKYVPALLLCYFIPAIINSLGLFDHDSSDRLYFMASRFLLPASLVLLCVNIDLRGVLRLGPKALIMFLTSTVSIIIGAPIALYLVSLAAPELLMGEGPDAIWRGLATIAGSWIGGGANQTAMKEIYGASDALFSAMIVVDVFVANIWMAFLLFGAGVSDKLDLKLKADNSAITDLRQRVEKQQQAAARVASFTDIMMILGVGFGMVALSHALSGTIGPAVGARISAILAENPDSWVRLFTSFGSSFFWLVVIATIGGVLLSFTRARNLEGAGASKFGSAFLYVLVGTIGLHMDIGKLISEWHVFKFILSIGFIWILVHISILLLVGKIIRAPFFFIAVGSQANIGGAASAPIVASAFSPALAPVGVLLAVLGYAVGTFGAIACAILMQALTI